MKKINCGLTQVDYIVHVSDIHIRNWKRHKEYQEVFDKLNLVVKNSPPNTIVMIGGDIVHAKTDMSPELIQMVSYFFTGLADLVPTFVICGNHDTNLNNNNRLDALTPIIDALKHPNLYYLKDTGNFEVGDVAFTVMSVLDQPENYPKADSIKKKVKRKFALYHGTVEASTTDTGIRLLQGLSRDYFTGYDAALLGDIHKRQILNKEPLIFYPGSLIQQNFGEAYEGHGPAILNVNTLECKFLEIPNDYGYFTLTVEDGVLPNNLPITAKTSVRLKIKNTSPAQLKRVLATLRKDYKNSDVVITNIDAKEVSKTTDATFSSGDVRRVEFQNEMIKEYLSQSKIDDETLEQIYTINKQLNSQLPHTETVRNVVWKPKRFEFSNMFSYGENNVVDFTNMNGLCGLFAPNHAGKSAILDALCFCLFDHSFRASKADQVLNNKSDWFHCKFNFELEGVDYFIEKRATRYAKGPLAGKLRVDIDFWHINEEGEVISLNGEQRRDTDKIIQSYVGSFDDFILTALSLQGNNSNFIEKTQGERKELLANFLDLNIFDQLYDLANKETRTSAILLEEYQKQDFEQKLGDAESVKEDCLNLYAKSEQEYKEIKEELDRCLQETVDLAELLRPNPAQDLNLTSLEKEKQDYQDAIVQQTARLEKLNALQNDLLINITTTKQQIQQYNEQELTQSFTEYTAKVRQQQQISAVLDKLKVTIKGKLDKLANLEKHEYDPNCKYCVDNVFVKDAIKTKQELEEDKQTVAAKLEDKKNVDQYLNNNKQISTDYEGLTATKAELKEMLDKQKLAKSQIETIENAIENTKHKLKLVESNIALYHENESTIKHNQKLQSQIEVVKQQAAKIKIKEDAAAKEMQSLHGKIAVAEKTIDECLKNIEHMQELADKQIAYGLYTQAISRDGIQYNLISKAIPHIEQYVNNLLSQITDFTLSFEADGKSINVYICYETNKWPLELSSGMEKFISSLAIRVALIKITNLPKPNFLAIDEGLGVLDSTNLNSMHMLFNHLKDLFKYTLVISHIDVVRDMVDHILTIDRNGEFSYINYQ
jgi:DNA repair exonuclease SbcCD ATPase subunit/DNA repair exonuclease SbcCD nuclease subunit